MPRTIPHADYNEGIRLCRKNAKSLTIKARNAFEKGCFHAAYLLAIAALEEVGKATVIIKYWNNENISYEKYKKEICNHELKTTLAITLIDENLIEQFSVGPREHIEIILDENRRDTLVETRTRSIYVDYNFKEKKWVYPLEKMDELASTAIRESRQALSLFGRELKHKGIEIPENTK